MARPKTQPGTAVGRVKPARRINPAPVVGRTETLDQLKREVGIYSKTVERHEEAIDKWLRPLATELPGQLADLKTTIGSLRASVDNSRDAMASFAKRLDEHDEKLEAVEQRGQDHEVRWQLLDAEELPPRVAALEERKRAQTIEQAVSTAVVAEQRKWIAFGLRHGWKVLSAVFAALAGYYGLIK